MSAPIAAPLIARTVPADGLTFTARSTRGGTVSGPCPLVAARLSARGWTITINSRPEGAAARCAVRERRQSDGQSKSYR